MFSSSTWLIFCRSKSTVARTSSKVNCAVYGSGLSASGALGIPSLVVNDKAVQSKEQHKPTRITYLNTQSINKISAGFGFSVFASNNKLYGAGLNNRSQITTHIGDDIDRSGQDYYISCKKLSLPEGGKIIALSSGRAHTLVVTDKGVYAFGDNCHGQCGFDPSKYPEVYGTHQIPLPKITIPSDSPVVQAHCALDTSFVITARGEIFSFGLNEDGQCSNGTYGIQFNPAPVLGDVSETKIISVSGSSDTLFALSDKGEAFVWGQCEYKQAGEGLNDIQLNYSRHLPFNIGRICHIGSSSSAAVALTSDGKVYVWGVGVLGMGPSVQKLTRPSMMDQPLFDNKKVIKVFGGNSSMGAINEDGICFVWGQNRYGLLGLSHSKCQFFPYQVSLPGYVQDISLGPDHSLFLMR